MLIKLRFRFPDLVFGALLAVAIFAIGMVFASSRPDFRQAVQIQEADKHGEKAKTPDGELTGLAWFTKDAAGVFTFMLVIVGGVQAYLFLRQLKLIDQSLAPAKEAADAARLAAEHIPRVERAYVFVEPEFSRPNNFVFRVKFTLFNHGKTPAVVIGYGIRNIVDGILRMPDNSEHFPLAAISDEFVIPAGGNWGPMTDECILDRTRLDAVGKGEMAVFFYGTIHYQDVFGIDRYTHFRWEAHGDPVRFAVVGGPPHNKRT